MKFKFKLSKFQGLFMIYGAIIGIISDGLLTILIGAFIGLVIGALIDG